MRWIVLYVPSSLCLLFCMIFFALAFGAFTCGYRKYTVGHRVSTRGLGRVIEESSIKRYGEGSGDAVLLLWGLLGLGLSYYGRFGAFVLMMHDDEPAHRLVSLQLCELCRGTFLRSSYQGLRTLADHLDQRH